MTQAANRNPQSVATTGSSDAAARREQEAGWLTPPVDIFEDSDGVTLVADMPGVRREQLDVRVENEALTLQAEAQIEMPQGIEPLYADVRSTRYRRTFTLSGDLDTEGISASLKDGVVTVRVPKRAEARPRRIEVKTS